MLHAFKRVPAIIHVHFKVALAFTSIAGALNSNVASASEVAAGEARGVSEVAAPDRSTPGVVPGHDDETRSTHESRVTGR